jgi:predicted DNA-binding protein (MmcQ/YjbR family)
MSTVLIDGSIPEEEIYKLLDHSYDFMRRGLKKTVREQIERL